MCSDGWCCVTLGYRRGLCALAPWPEIPQLPQACAGAGTPHSFAPALHGGLAKALVCDQKAPSPLFSRMLRAVGVLESTTAVPAGGWERRLLAVCYSIGRCFDVHCGAHASLGPWWIGCDGRSEVASHHASARGGVRTARSHCSKLTGVSGTCPGSRIENCSEGPAEIEGQAASTASRRGERLAQSCAEWECIVLALFII